MIKLFTVAFIAASSCFAQSMPVKSATVTPAVVHASAPVAPAVPSPPPVSVKSFKEWKNEKVQMAIKKVTITKAQIEYRKLNRKFLQMTGKDTETERYESMLKQDMYSLEIAQEMGIPEFLIYLSKQEDTNEAYKEAAEKMTPEEVRQLIKAYADSMFSSNGTGLKVGPTAMDKSDSIK